MKRYIRIPLAAILLLCIAFAVSAVDDMNVDQNYTVGTEHYNVGGSLTVYDLTLFSANAYTGLDTPNGHKYHIVAQVELFAANDQIDYDMYDYQWTNSDEGNLFVYASVGDQYCSESASGYHSVYVYDYEMEMNMETGVLESTGLEYSILSWSDYTGWTNSQPQTAASGVGEVYRETVEAAIQ